MTYGHIKRVAIGGTSLGSCIWTRQVAKVGPK
jgi:hypothetical protein